ncbi:MAG TPA: (Fe-S)-binding protein, partial [Bacteroidota bacterium]
VAIRSLSGRRLPAWNRALPLGAHLPPSGAGPTPADPLTVVYLPSCITRTMGPAPREDVSDGVVQRTHKLLLKAGCRIVYPERLSDLCCGMAFDSKGFKAEGARKAAELEAALLKASGGGRHPVLVDMSPCLLRMRDTLNPALRLYEPAEFILQFLAGRLRFHPLPGPVMLHATCSTIRMGRTADLLKLAGMCAERVITPDEIECCGWAGDRGFTFPELNASALAPLRKAVPPEARHGYSTSRTCEIGLTLHSGIPYRSIVYLVDDATAPR